MPCFDLQLVYAMAPTRDLVEVCRRDRSVVVGFLEELLYLFRRLYVQSAGGPPELVSHELAKLVLNIEEVLYCFYVNFETANLHLCLRKAV